MASYEDSYEERQEDEVEFLQAVFPGDFEDCRLNDSWKIKRPPEIRLTLVPQKSMGGTAGIQRPLSIKLHAKYPTDYPDSAPELKLEEAQGLTDDQVKEITKEVTDLSRARVGEVMMLEIAQHVQAFLHKHDRPHISLYEEMLVRQRMAQEEERRRMEAEREEWRMREEEEHRQIEEEIMRKKAELRRHSEDESEEDSEDSASAALTPDKQSTPLRSLTPERLHPPVGEVLSVRGKEGVMGGRTKPRLAMEHIHRGKCLGESVTGGHTVYVGLDMESGDLLAIYEWVLQCRTDKRGDTRRQKQVASIQQEFDSFQQRAVRHPNLVQYLSMNHTYRDNKITVEIVMEYVGGGSVSSLLRNPDCGPVGEEALCHYCKQLLEVLNYLHSQGIVHNDIKPSLVFFDSGGCVKLGGFSIIKRLSDLHRAMNTHIKPSLTTPTEEIPAPWLPGVLEMRGGKKGDILKLGMLILCAVLGKMDLAYPPTIPDDLPEQLRDFLAKCLDTNEVCRFPAHDLLRHPFISPSLAPSQSHTLGLGSTVMSRKTTETTTGGVLPFYRQGSMQFQRSDSIVGSPSKPLLIGQSRLETEFEELEILGSGGFGDVIKVRNHLDSRLYAIKRIRLLSDSKMMNRITKEVEHLSQMNHENVVRYYNAWIETYAEEEYKRHSGTFLNEEDIDSSQSDSAEHLNDTARNIANDVASTSSESLESESDYSLDSTDSYHSADDDFHESDDSFIIFEATSSPAVIRTSTGKTRGEEEEEGVFMDEFSSGSGEHLNFLGELETQVLDISLPRIRHPTTESSDTVVFADSSTTGSKPIPMQRDRRHERRKQRTGQVQFLYIQMEYCEHQTVRQLIDSSELWGNEERCWRLFREIVEGLEHIHSKGMIHRDLKPGNIFLNSSDHIKIGDFGLATSYKHAMSKQNSVLAPNSSLVEQMQDGETGLVGTAAYLAPELYKPSMKYSQKVDIYSLGLIFFEMCHPPPSTMMERQKLVADIRRKDINLPESFEEEKRPKQAKMVRWLLNHTPHERPTATDLLQCPLLPPKMEDEELQEVLLRTIQSTNSTRYAHLINELFTQEGSRVSEFSYFLDPQDAKRTSQKKSKFSFCYTLLQQLVHSKLVTIFTRHGASYLQPPFLSPRSTLYSGVESVAQLMDRSGAIVSLPYDHRVNFARYVNQQDVSYLKRYTIGRVFRESKVLGSHPREAYQCAFDVVTPSGGSLVPDAEVMFVVSEIISELPGLQDGQYGVWVNHTSLLSSILNYCSIPPEKHNDVCAILHKLMMGAVKLPELEKRLKERNLQLSPLAAKTLQRFVSSEVPLEEVQSLLEPLLKDKTKVGSLSTQAWQEINTVISLFKSFGAKDQVYLHLGLSNSPSHFSGVIFQFVETSNSQSSSKRKRRVRRVPLAVGGRYDKLLPTFRRPGKQPFHPGVCVVGVSVMEEAVMSAVLSAYQQGSCQVTKCSVLVCWLGHESLQNECIGLVRDLWAQGIAADLVYESLELESVEDIQDFCRRNFIPHVVILSDKTLFYERKQVKVRTFDGSIVVEKVMTTGELVEFVQQKHGHGVERSDSTESGQGSVRSNVTGVETQSNAMPPVNVTITYPSKLPGNVKRRYHDQALTKLIPLLQRFSTKHPLEVLVVDLKADLLCSLAAEVNKFVGSSESKDLSSVVKTLTESHTASNKKYISRVCENVQELLNTKSHKVPVIFLYSHSAEYCQTILNSLESLIAT